MSYENNISNNSGWWRWPLLPFAAFLGAIVGTSLIGLLQWFGMKMQGGFSTDGWYFIYVMPVISSAIFGWLYVLITLNVAPKGKFVAAIAMVILLGAMAVFGQVFAWSNYSLSQFIQSTIGTLATVIAAIISLISYKDEYK